MGKLLKDVLIVKEVIFRCCKEVLCAVCMGFGGYRACFVRCLIGFSTPILEGIETKNGSYWKIKDFADFLSKKMNGVFRYLKKLF